MGRFLDHLELEDTGQDVGGRPIYRLLHDFRYVVTAARRPEGRDDNPRWCGELILCRSGETTDFASTPRFLWLIIPPTLGRWAAVIHDHLYRTGEMPRNVADAIFRAALRDAPHQGAWARRLTSAALIAAAHWTPYGSWLRRKLLAWSGSTMQPKRGVDPVRRWLMWAGVRLFGRFAWNQYREAERL